MRRDHEQHRNASDERVRLRKIAAHEEKVRDVERARERRRTTQALNQQEWEYVDADGVRVPNHDILIEGRW
jgi:hypothetical protein